MALDHEKRMNKIEAETSQLRKEILRLEFQHKKDVADFFYSLDGKNWNAIGTTLKMTYTLPHFMGYRFALFNYATKTTGGSAAFDFFHITDTIQ